MMSKAPPGLLMVWTDIPANLEPGFNDWYNREHMPERILGVPGFVRGRRFVATDGGPRYLAVYEAASNAVLFSEPYLALKRNFDPNSLHYVPHFQNTQKMAGQVTASLGSAEGGVVSVTPLKRAAGRADELRAWIAGQLLPELIKQRGILRAWYGEQDAATLASVAADIPRKSDKFLDAVLVLEGITDEALDVAMPLLAWERLKAQGAEPDAAPARMRVGMTVHVPPVR